MRENGSIYTYVCIHIYIHIYIWGLRENGYIYTYGWTYQVALLVKNLPANAVDIRDVGTIPGLGRYPRGGHGYPLQYSCLENPMDRGAWWLESIGSQRV